MGINTTALDPANIRLFGNGGKMLPELNKAFRYDDLQENTIQFVGNTDNSFDNSEYILFYATGPTEWKKTNAKTGLKFRATKNLYSDTSFYFVTVDQGNGKRISRISSLSATPNVNSNSYDYYNYHEEDLVNFGKSGRDFYGEQFDFVNSYNFTWNDGDFVPDSIITEASMIASYSQITYFSITGNGLSFPVSIASTNGNDIYAPYAQASTNFGSGINQNSSEINILITKQTPKSVGYLDKLTVNARRFLNVGTKQFLFRDTRVSSPGNICNFSINNPANSIVTLWNVSDPLNPFIQDSNLNGSSLNFTANADSLNDYCIAPSTDFYTPQFVGKVANQNLHAITQADYVIVTHPLFIKEAQELAVFHQQKEQLTYAIATVDQIYNEFSSGRQDISAIRDFIRMIYSRNLSANKQVKYVLLMGDGSYINKSRNLINNSNLVPTYQSLNSLSSTHTLASDDFYGLMSPDEGYDAEDIGNIDIGIGRFTCRSVAEVKAVIAKIKNYYERDANFQISTATPENCNTLGENHLGDWRNWLLFLGDDEDGAEHMRESDSLARLVKSISTNYNLDKIFLDAYQRFSTPGGGRYPDASEDFIKRIEKELLFSTIQDTAEK